MRFPDAGFGKLFEAAGLDVEYTWKRVQGLMLTYTTDLGLAIA